MRRVREILRLKHECGASDRTIGRLLGATRLTQRSEVRAVWHGLRGEWDQAHAIVQALEDADAAWVHAWLHRVEGDPGNAGYWYRRAGRGATDREGQAIAAALLGG